MKRTTRPVRAVPEVLGWYGVAAILTAYAAVSFHAMGTDSIWYPVLNGTGALGLVIDAYYQKDYQPLALNVVWVLIALFSLIKMWI